MKLKEAFRYQNKLQSLIDNTLGVLGRDQNIVTIKSTYLKKKVMPEAEDEIITDIPTTDYSEHITEIAEFLMYLITEKEKLTAAIRAVKMTCSMDIDGETSMNTIRQTAMKTFAHMADLKSSEVVIPYSGYAYRFNAEGNQITYKCDVRKVTTINYDRKEIKKFLQDLAKKSDAVSIEIDRYVVNTDVQYDPPCEFNDSFADVFEAFLGRKEAKAG